MNQPSLFVFASVPSQGQLQEKLWGGATAFVWLSEEWHWGQITSVMGIP